MQVTDKTQFADVAAFLECYDQESIQRLKGGAESKYGSPWGLTLGQFFSCTDGDFSHIGADVKNPSTMTALQFYWVQSFKDMCQDFSKALQSLTPPQTPDAKRASAGCRPMSFKESVLTYCREYFGLKSFKDVYDLSIDDFLLAKKDTYNKAVFEQGMADIQKSKSKK